MLLMKKVIFLFCILGLVACNRDRVKISGRILNADKQVLHLDEVNVYDSKALDSVVLKSDGRFSFTYESHEAGFFQLRLAKDQLIVLFPEPGEHIKIKADLKDMNSSLSIEGSPSSEEITVLIHKLNKARASLDSISALFDKAQTDSVRIKLNEAYRDILNSHRKYSISYILSHYKSLSSLYALYQQYQTGGYVFYKTSDLQFFRIVSDSLKKYHPGSKHVAALKAYTDNMIGRYNSQMLIRSAQKSSSLPEIRLPDMAGDTVNLADFSGKYVLLCFWVSGDQNSVRQNLELKKVYPGFRNKGFEIVQVSLDNSVEAWKRAVRYDELPWVSLIDTRYPNSIIAGNYNITSIPTNYLISKDNLTILAKNLTPAELKDKLNDLVK
jgi:peroxiredoxin